MNARIIKLIRFGLTAKTDKPEPPTTSLSIKSSGGAGFNPTRRSSGGAGFNPTRRSSGGEGLRPTRQTAGLTLIEVLIALSLVVMLMSLGVPAISRITGQKVSATARRFVALVRTVRNDSILLSNIHRIVIDLDNDLYWVESQKQMRLIGEEDEETRRKKLKASKDKKVQDPDDENFLPVEKYNRKPIPLPSGVVFEGVLKEREGSIKQGKAFIHFFPSGFVEQSIIYINQQGSTTKAYSIVIRPTAGRVDIQNKFIDDFDEEVSK